MPLLSDLRGRVALFFAGFGALISLIMVIAVYQSAHDLGQRLIDETLSAELDDYIARRERNPASLPPATVVVHGYVQGNDGVGDVPTYLAWTITSPGASGIRHPCHPPPSSSTATCRATMASAMCRLILQDCLPAVMTSTWGQSAIGSPSWNVAGCAIFCFTILPCKPAANNALPGCSSCWWSP